MAIITMLSRNGTRQPQTRNWSPETRLNTSTATLLLRRSAMTPWPGARLNRLTCDGLRLCATTAAMRLANRSSRGSPSGCELSSGSLHTLSESWEPTAYFQAVQLVQNTPNRSPLSVGLIPSPRPALRQVERQVRRLPQE